MRAAETPPGVRLPGADRDLARAEAWQRLRSRVPQELSKRQSEGPAAVLVRIAQLLPPGADRAGTASCRADDLAAVLVTGRAGSDELPVAQVAFPPGFPAGVAEPVGHPPLARAALNKAEPVSEQGMTWRGRESLGLRVPPGLGEKGRVEVTPEIPRAVSQRTRPGKPGQDSAHRAPSGRERAATRSTARRSRSWAGCR